MKKEQLAVQFSRISRVFCHLKKKPITFELKICFWWHSKQKYPQLPILPDLVLSKCKKTPKDMSENPRFLLFFPLAAIYISNEKLYRPAVGRIRFSALITFGKHTAHSTIKKICERGFLKVESPIVQILL